MLRHSLKIAAIALGLTAGSAATASASEATVAAASCFPQGSFFSKRFEAIVAKVNETGAGVVKIDYLGGAPAIGSPFTLVQKLAQGVYDLANCTGAYYQNVVPEADAWKMLELTPAEVRANGGWALMEEIHRKKNLVPLARIHHGTQFHLFLGDGHGIEKPDLSGLHLRVAPIYTNFFKALGATTQNSNLAQIFTLMENGTVMGYGWPVIGHQPGWDTVTKYRVDPGFYDVDIEVLANARSWSGLSDAAKAIIVEAATAVEVEATTGDPAMSAKAAAKQAADGFEIISFDGADREKWLSTASDAGWAGIVENSPEYGPKLRELFSAQ